MTNIRAIREGLAASLSTLTGWQVSPYILSNPTPPYAMIGADETMYDLGFDDDATRLWFGVTVVVPYTSDLASQAALDEYRAGSRSVRHALEADQELGGACDAVHVVSAGPDTLYGDTGIGCQFRVEVLT